MISHDDEDVILLPAGLTGHDFKVSPPPMKALGGSKMRSGKQGG